MLARTCEACGSLIRGGRVLELSLRLLRTDQGNVQDALEEMEGDYCAGCLRNGAALEDLVKGFTKYPQRLLESPTPRTTQTGKTKKGAPA